MKVLESIDILTKKELDHLDFVINQSKRNTLKKLHGFLKSSRNQFDKKKTFKAVFGTAYTDSKDYLLRNEFRLYADKIQHILASASIDSDMETLLYLRTLLQRKSHKLFETECKNAEKQWEKTEQFDLLTELHKLEFTHFYQNKFKLDLQSISNLNSMLQKHYNTNLRRHGADQKALQVANAYLSYNIQKMGLEPLKPLAEDANLRSSSSLVKYLNQKKSTFTATDESRIKLLEKALELLEHVHKKAINVGNERMVILNNLALEYFFIRQYENAVDVLEAMLEGMGKANKVSLSPIYYNYISALLKSQQYQKALTVWKENERLLEQPGNIIANKMKCVKIMCMILNGEVAIAKRSIPDKIHEGSDDDYLYLRLTLSIIYYSEGKYDLCLRENTNLLQVNSSGDRFEAYMYCARIFNRFLRNADDKKAILKIHQELEGFIGDIENRHGDILPLRWLLQTINGKLAVIN